MGVGLGCGWSIKDGVMVSMDVGTTDAWTVAVKSATNNLIVEGLSWIELCENKWDGILQS